MTTLELCTVRSWGMVDSDAFHAEPRHCVDQGSNAWSVESCGSIDQTRSKRKYYKQGDGHLTFCATSSISPTVHPTCLSLHGQHARHCFQAGDTALILASYRGGLDVAELLVDNGANVNLRNKVR